MRSFRSSRILLFAVSFVMASVLYLAASPQQPAANDIESVIQSVRADFRADKVALITQLMQFNESESAAFWPIYRQYEVELSRLNDQKVALIKSYASKFTTLTDADAKTMAEQAFNYESRRTDLKKKYYGEFNKQIPAVTVTKFFQLEHRLDLLVDLKLASELPSLLVRPVTATSR